MNFIFVSFCGCLYDICWIWSTFKHLIFVVGCWNSCPCNHCNLPKLKLFECLTFKGVSSLSVFTFKLRSYMFDFYDNVCTYMIFILTLLCVPCLYEVGRQRSSVSRWVLFYLMIYNWIEIWKWRIIGLKYIICFKIKGNSKIWIWICFVFFLCLILFVPFSFAACVGRSR
jgi:hypothetical protein